MAIANIIAQGIGFTPGSVSFVVTHGFLAGAAVAVGAGRPRARLYILPDGNRYYGDRKQAREMALRQFAKRRRNEPAPPVEFVAERAQQIGSVPFVPAVLEIVELPAFEPRALPDPPALQLENVLPFMAEWRDEEDAIIALLIGGS